MNLKFKIQNSKCKLNEAGFTLLEMLISMTIGLVVLGSIFSSFTTQKKSYELQEQITVMEQNLRVPLDIITRDLRTAGYNPTEDLTTGTSVGLVPDASTTISANSIRILSDIAGLSIDRNGDGDTADTEDTDGDGDTGDSNEVITYTFTAGDIRRNGDPLVSNIISLRFRYYDSTGTEITTLSITGTNLTNIRVVEVSITARTEREDSTYTSAEAEDTNGDGVWDSWVDSNGNDTIDGINISGTAADGGCRTRTLMARVRTRNIGL